MIPGLTQKTAALLAACMLPLTAPAQTLFQYQGDVIAPEVESTYEKGLKYLAASQQSNGTWAGNYGAQPGVVGLAILAMLAHGDDPNFGPYQSHIKRGLSFLLASMRSESGMIGTSMYNHGFATLALAEAYGAVDDPRLGPALKQAVSLILTAQANNPLGAWRYEPGRTDADTTISGAQLVALLAARNAGLSVPDTAIAKGLHFLSQMSQPGGGFGYTTPSRATPPQTAIGTLVFALAGQKDAQVYVSGFAHLRQINAHASRHLYYYLYYASQAYFHADMTAWREWNRANIDRLISIQNENGSWPGPNGPAFSTSAALLSLAVNYRFLPIYER